MSEDRPGRAVFISPRRLEVLRAGPGPLCIVDLSAADNYAAGHVPGARHLDETRVVAVRKPVGGLLPDEQKLSALLEALGITPRTRVVAYDDQGNSRSGRLLWTLEVIGHTHAAILDGGLGAWREAGLEISRGAAPATDHGLYPVRIQPGAQADRHWILEHLEDPEVVFLDVRTPKEFRGEDVRSLRGGHIPGAVNYNWLLSQDHDHHRRLRPLEEIRAELEALGVSADKQVVVYCQTHMRSSHMFLLLRQLGFERLRGYPGAWSDWGNDPGLPVEV